LAAPRGGTDRAGGCPVDPGRSGHPGGARTGLARRSPRRGPGGGRRRGGRAGTDPLVVDLPARDRSGAGGVRGAGHRRRQVGEEAGLIPDRPGRRAAGTCRGAKLIGGRGMTPARPPRASAAARLGPATDTEEGTAAGIYGTIVSAAVIAASPADTAATVAGLFGVVLILLKALLH